MSSRLLRPNEIKLADKVFQGTIPYGGVRIVDTLGFADREYTICHPGQGERDDIWDVYVGKKRFLNLEADLHGQIVLIHELTHVWQSAHGIWPAIYIFNSMWHQLTEGDKAYEYKTGLNWSAYNVEQQAHIVQDWFVNGLDHGDPNYQYIKNNIQAATRFKFP